MIVLLSPSPIQLRHYLDAAETGFDTLDEMDAVGNARDNIRAALAYLDRLDSANETVSVHGVERIKSGVWRKLFGSQRD